MGNWASTLASQDATRTRLVVITVSVFVMCGLVLIAVGGCYAYKSRIDRQEEMYDLRLRAERARARARAAAPPMGLIINDSSAVVPVRTQPPAIYPPCPAHGNVYPNMIVLENDGTAAFYV